MNTFFTWIMTVVVVLAVGAGYATVAAQESDETTAVVANRPLEVTLMSLTPPPLPGYVTEHSSVAYSGERTITYDVMTRGTITANMDEFKRLSAETLADERGWSRLGITFKEVENDGDFSLVLSAANQMTSFSTGCHELWSCNVGRYVIINQDRWLGATDPWNAAGGNLRDYRHMVVNHEVGHNLGRDHSSCDTPGTLAAVMQQQSYDLQGCEFNPWPLPSEVVRVAE